MKHDAHFFHFESNHTTSSYIRYMNDRRFRARHRSSIAYACGYQKLKDVLNIVRDARILSLSTKRARVQRLSLSSNVSRLFEPLSKVI